MLKKIDRNCFLCYKKSFLFYSIFNLRWPNNSSGCPLSRRELTYYIIGAISVSSIFSNFFRLFSDFFLTVLKLFRLPFRTGQLAYSIIPPRRSQSFFTHFFAFFCFFLSFFSRFAGRTSCCVFTQYMVQYIRFYTSPGEKRCEPFKLFFVFLPACA